MFKMRIGAPTATRLPENTSWSKMQILDQRTLLISLCIGSLVAICIALMWRICVPSSLPLGTPSWGSIIVVMITLVIGHEALHMSGFPKFGLGSDTVVGVWPEFGSPYVSHSAPMKRNRFLLSVSLPFLVITILPLLLSSHFGAYIDHLSWISVLNSIGAGSDIVIFTKLSLSAPMKSIVIESGENLYWSDNLPSSHPSSVALSEQ